MFLALRSDDGAILDCSDDFLTLFNSAPQNSYFITESWIEAGQNRKKFLIDGLNNVFYSYYDDYGQGIDKAITWLRQHNVLSEKYSSLLLIQSNYGKLPDGALANMVIKAGLNKCL